MADTLALEASDASRKGSTPFLGTTGSKSYQITQYRRGFMRFKGLLLCVVLAVLCACGAPAVVVTPTNVPDNLPAVPTATIEVEIPTEIPTVVPTKVPTEIPTEIATNIPIATPTTVVTNTVVPTAVIIPTATAAPVAAVTEWKPRQLTAKLTGSGATFPNPLYQVWISVYTKNIVPGVQLSYQSVGSGQGQRDFIGYLTDFGGSDSAVSSTRVSTEAPDAIHIPTVLGGVMPMYNLPGLKAPMRFSAETLVGIYLGDIKKWNDERIAADNPGVTLPENEIVVVYRSDSSGTTSIWTDYLSKVSGAWKSVAGSGNTVNWPVGIGAPGNAGVSSTVQKTEGAVGYVEVGYALGAGFTLPFVKNSSGNYVQPLLNNVSAAAAGLKISSDVQKLASSITNGSDAQAFPISGFTYILVRKDTYTDVTKAQALSDFIYWGLTEGQGAANRLGYAPLPEGMRKASINALKSIRVNGEAVLDAPVK
jgi:phosphate transport system substrate-binding protein